MTKEPDSAVEVDHGPADSYHPIYDSVVEWLDGERQPKPITTRKRRTTGPIKRRART